MVVNKNLHQHDQKHSLPTNRKQVKVHTKKEIEMIVGSTEPKVGRFWEYRFLGWNVLCLVCSLLVSFVGYREGEFVSPSSARSKASLSAWFLSFPSFLSFYLSSANGDGAVECWLHSCFHCLPLFFSCSCTWIFLLFLISFIVEWKILLRCFQYTSTFSSAF